MWREQEIWEARWSSVLIPVSTKAIGHTLVTKGQVPKHKTRYQYQPSRARQTRISTRSLPSYCFLKKSKEYIWTFHIICDMVVIVRFKHVGKTNGGNRKSCCASDMVHPKICSNPVLVNLLSCRAVNSNHYMISRWSLRFSCCQCFDKLAWCLRVYFFYTAPLGFKRCDQGNLFQILTKQAMVLLLNQISPHLQDSKDV